MGISASAHPARAALGNACLAAEVFVARVARIWNAATRSTYVNCNGKRAGRRQQPPLLAFRNASLRSTAIYTQIALHDPEQAGILYFTLPLRPFASATLKEPERWNVRTRCAVCRRKFVSTLRRMDREEGCPREGTQWRMKKGACIIREEYLLRCARPTARVFVKLELFGVIIYGDVASYNAC